MTRIYPFHNGTYACNGRHPWTRCTDMTNNKQEKFNFLHYAATLFCRNLVVKLAWPKSEWVTLSTSICCVKYSDYFKVKLTDETEDEHYHKSFRNCHTRFPAHRAHTYRTHTHILFVQYPIRIVLARWLVKLFDLHIDGGKIAPIKVIVSPGKSLWTKVSDDANNI